MCACGPGQLSRYSDSLRAGQSRDRIPVGGRKRFSSPVQTGPVAHPVSYTMGTGSLSGGKAAVAWRWPPTPSSAEVKERVQIYLYSPSGPSWPVLGWILPLLCVPNANCSTGASFKPKVKDNFYSILLVILLCTTNWGTKCCKSFIRRPIVCHLIRLTKLALVLCSPVKLHRPPCRYVWR